MKFTKIPVTIDALPWLGYNEEQIAAFAGDKFRAIDPVYAIETYGSDKYTAEVYDELHDTWVGMKNTNWIIRGVRGEYYPIDDSVLWDTYEPTTYQ